VVAVDRERRRENANGTPVTRPLVTVRTPDPVRLTAGTEVVAVSRRNQTGTVRSVVSGAGGAEVTLELRGGMGRARVPPPGSLPDVGDDLCYTSVLAANVPTPPLPDADRTPWTHGGPPAPYRPDGGEDAED
jgi:molybdopterin-binding protein